MTRPVQISVCGQIVRLCLPERAVQQQLPEGTAWGQDPLPLEENSAGPPSASTPSAPNAPSTLAAGEQQERAVALVAQAGRTLMELLQGRRPGGQLVLWAGDEAAAALLAWRNQHDWQHASVLGVRACIVHPLAVEGALHLREPEGDFCAALRLEHQHGRWRVVVFDVLLPAAAGLARAS